MAKPANEADTSVEMTDMALVYGECHQNSEQAALQYALRFPARRHPGRGFFHRLVNRLRQTGSFHLRRGRPRRNDARPPERTEDVRRLFTANPHTSTRVVARQINRSHSLVHKILKKYLKWRPWKKFTTNLLTARDHDRRVAFCDWICDQVSY